MRRDVALAGSAALGAGILLGFAVERLRRMQEASAIPRVVPTRARPAPLSATREETRADLLERYRTTAAV